MLYDLCQGVTDLVVKLYMLVQLRMVGISELRKGQSEILTKELFQQVAREEFVLVQPMIEALRENDPIKCSKFDDLKSFNDHIGLVLNRALGGENNRETTAEVPPPIQTNPDDTIEQRLSMALTQLGVAQDVAKVLIEEALASTESKDPLVLLNKIIASLTASPPKIKKPKAVPAPAEAMPAEDLRRIVSEAGKANISAYDALLAAGVIQPPMREFAA